MVKRPSRWVDKTGMQFGRLLVLGPEGEMPAKRWRVRCDCGTETVSRLRDAKSCGCYRKERMSKPDGNSRWRHGANGTGAHRAWRAMKSRCENPRAANFKYYGGRGIKVCDRWQLFENFLADMGERPEEMTLDRVDTDGPYSAENCRWSSMARQVANRRVASTNVVGVCIIRHMRRRGASCSDIANAFGMYTNTVRGIADGSRGNAYWEAL